MSKINIDTMSGSVYYLKAFGRFFDMAISEDVSSDLVLNDSKIRTKRALDRIVSIIQIYYSNKVIAKLKNSSWWGDFGGSYKYWAIVERVPVRFLNFTLWRKDRILVSTNGTTFYNGGSMYWDIYERKIAETAIGEIKKFSAHYPESHITITKHFRPTCIEPGHLISEDVLL